MAETGASAVTGKTGFRSDIEGLRALAIIPILFNHAGVAGWLGGYIGVDIFFVISGYLITGILVRDVGAGRFSLASFYRRRVLRIFPALFAMLAATTLVAWTAMTPGELVAYGRSLLATVLFGSNFYFYGHTGYFESAALNSPLLHTWSLAVEEQFYVFWPLLIAATASRSRGGARSAVIAVALVSLAVSEWLVRRDLTAAFYLIPSRVWEFGAGAALVFLPLDRRPPRWLREAAGAVAVLVILYCIHAYRQPLLFPGLTALAPCLATAALIATGPDTLTARALSLPPVRFIGRISYSLYLWHWPVIIFASLWLFLPPSPGVTIGEIALSILLGWLSYRLFEEGGRKLLTPLPVRRLLLSGAAAMVAGVALALTIVASRGGPGRFSPAALQLAAVLDRDEQVAERKGSCFVVAADDRFDAGKCLRGRGDRPSILLIGDSMAAHLWPGLVANASRYDLLQATMIGCPPSIYADAPPMTCRTFFHDMMTGWMPRHRPDIVLLAGYYLPTDLPELDRTLAALRRTGQRAILVGPMPDYNLALPRLLFFGGDERARKNLKPVTFTLDAQMREIAARSGAPYISPLDLLCRPGGCRTLARPGVPLQFDEHHLTHEGSDEAVRLMMPGIDRAMRSTPTH